MKNEKLPFGGNSPFLILNSQFLIRHIYKLRPTDSVVVGGAPT